MESLELQGLTRAEAAQLLQRHGFNELPSARRKSAFAVLFQIAREPMILLLIVCSLLYLSMGDLEEGLLLVGSVIIVLAITLYQESKSERALEALRDLSSPRALVIREGKENRVPGREVVPGDLVILREGDRIAADAELLVTSHLRVDESMLTGESVPVRKRAIASDEPRSVTSSSERLHEVFSGTLVVGGSGIARVLRTGLRTELGKIGKSLEGLEQSPTLLQKEVAKLVKIFGVVGVGLSFVVAVLYRGTTGSWSQGALAGVAAAMSLLPEELPVILTIFLALGAWRISKRNVLTRNVASTEGLGSVTVLCVDKTGTLTKNQMAIRELRTWDGAIDLLEKPASTLPEEFHSLVEYGTLASRKDPFDPMEKAIRSVIDLKLAGTEHIHPHWDLVREYPLSEKLLAMSCVWTSPEKTDFVIAAKGAPEAVADLCHLDESDLARLSQAVKGMADRGMRVLGVAQARFERRDLPEIQHDFVFQWVGLIGFEDPIRAEVPQAIQECYQAGIRVIMMTGDYAGTAQSIARQIGLRNPEQAITGAQLDSMSDEELKSRIRDTSIFARVVPEQKLRIVTALKAIGEIVGMTGDGVNDAPSLKRADVGIAMGKRGTDVAREASDLVLLDDDFASIVTAIRLGRRIVDNIKRAMSYVFAVHVPIAGIAILPVAFGFPAILFPAHIVFLELIIDPACTLVFESGREQPDIMTRAPRPAHQPMFGARDFFASTIEGALVLVLCLGLYSWIYSQGDARRAATAAFAALVLGNLGLILGNLSTLARTEQGESNPALKWVLSGALALLIGSLYIPAVRPLFNFVPLGSGDALLCLGVGFLSMILVFFLRALRKGK